ncbi:MAG TPA: hypothetical protein VN914_11820 [Polyangia bacterium]|nr:hypothetical protein [Polyangia bacterium]
MSARAALATLALCALFACKENIPRPPDDVDDAGLNPPVDVSSLDGPESKLDSADSAPTPTCGQGGQACCPGNVCNGGGCCVNNQCVANGTACRADATCLGGSCGGCGSGLPMPQECCAARACTASRTVCLGPGAGLCQGCGAAGQSCCGDAFCEGNLRCDTSVAPPGLCVPK